MDPMILLLTTHLLTPKVMHFFCVSKGVAKIYIQSNKLTMDNIVILPVSY